jgi:hypothetical protein
MSRRTATNNQDTSPKRVRFDHTAKDPNGESKQDTPKSLADSLIRRHVASLQPQFATILEKLGLTHLDLLHKLYGKKLQVARMESSQDFVPRSARIEFMFHMSKAANDRPEFIALKEETDSKMLEFQKFLTGQIIKATKIECESTAERLRDGFVKAVRLTVEGFLLGDTHAHGNNCDAIVSAMFENHADRLLCHTTFSNFESFCDIYKQTHKLTSFPIRRGDTTQSRFFSSGTTSVNPVPATPTTYHNLDSISRIIESIFISPFDEYLAQHEKNKIALELKRLSISHFTESTTAQTQMELDREPNLDRSQLQDLVKKHAQAENKLLVKELNKLRQQIQQLTSKNTERGHSPVRASNQKEMKTQSTRKAQKNTSRKQQLTQQAEGADNDTRKNSTKQKKTKDKKNTRKTGTKSKTGKNK